MIVTFTRRQRALLLFVSASGYTAWFSGLGGATEAAGFGRVPQPAVTIDARPPLPAVASIITRDPFASRTIASVTPDAPASGRAAAPGNANRMLAVAANAAANGIVVPDIDARAQPPAASSTLVLRATIVGPDPVAYVSDGTAMDIVRIGDSLGDRRISKIDLLGVVLSDGTRLELPDTYAPTPRPVTRPAASGERISLAALRRLLLPPQNAARAPSDATATTPGPVPTSTYPTPGPLATVNTQGLPVGVNPTPDPNDPTPYPYPYPYAPPVRH